jgi:hypothetical protein
VTATLRNGWLAAVLALGIAVRVVLIPITHGPDFQVWDLASAATLRGVNVYAHHPAYPGGPFAYFPLWTYVEVPFQWLAQHVAGGFTVWGKLPILAADIALALVLARESHDRGWSRRAVAAGVALLFWNPLLIYNSAYYGRFDSFGLLLTFLALRGLRGDGLSGPLWYAAAVAAKTFPVFLLPGVLHRTRSRVRLLGVLAAGLALLSLPYLQSVGPMLHDIVFYDATKIPQGLAAQTITGHAIGAGATRVVGYLLLLLFAAGTIALRRTSDLMRYTALVFVLFLLCSKVVLDQYLIWPMPWLVLEFAAARRIARAAAILLGVLTAVGMLANANIHPWGRSPAALIALLDLACLAYLYLAGRREVD